MFAAGMSTRTKQSLLRLSQASFIDRFYLAGGTAVALHLGHRLSFDLDFFSSKAFAVEKITQELQLLGKLTIMQKEPTTLLGTFQGTKVSFFYLTHPLIGRTEKYLDITIASPKDLIAMKLMAIAQRGTKRDFIDLYMLLHRKYSLKQCLSFLKQKYSRDEFSLTHIIRSLTYFEDADEDKSELQLLQPINWTQVKNYFSTAAPKLIDQL